jgi:hypothetical protein
MLLLCTVPRHFLVKVCEQIVLQTYDRQTLYLDVIFIEND